jgi:hypothetical protein
MRSARHAQHIAGPKTIKLNEAPSDFGSDFPDKKMPDSGVLSNKEAPTPEKFEEENQTLNLAEGDTFRLCKRVSQTKKCQILTYF